jgi:hypothetical protein
MAAAHMCGVDFEKFDLNYDVGISLNGLNDLNGLTMMMRMESGG